MPTPTMLPLPHGVNGYHLGSSSGSGLRYGKQLVLPTFLRLFRSTLLSFQRVSFCHSIICVIRGRVAGC